MRGALALAPEGTLTAGVSAPISGSLATNTPAASEDPGQTGSASGRHVVSARGPIHDDNRRAGLRSGGAR